MLECGHAEIERQAGLALEARDGSDFAGHLGRANRTKARDGGELTGAAGSLGNAGYLVFQSLDLALEFKDPQGILMDHGTDQAGISAKAGAILPGLDTIGVINPDRRQLQETGAANPGKLGQVLAAGQKVQEPQVRDIASDLYQDLGGGLQITMENSGEADTLVDNNPVTAAASKATPNKRWLNMLLSLMD